jgi:flagellar hook-length control protein FliK
VETQQNNGVGKIPLADLPGLLSQRIAHRLGSLEGHAGVVRLQFHLDPPELGSVAVRVAFDGGELKIHFFANDVVAKEALTAAVPELRAELGRIGLDLGETYVSVNQEHGRGFGPQLHQWRTGFWFSEGDSPHPEAVIDEGINYLV